MSCNLAIVSGDEDGILLMSPYCTKCAIKKLHILEKFDQINRVYIPLIFELTKDESQVYYNLNKLRACKVKCECNRGS